MKRAVLKTRRGASYIAALAMLIIFFALSLAMLRFSGSSIVQQNSQDKKAASESLAQGGIDYAYWKIHYENADLPFSEDVSLPSGKVHVDAIDDGDRDPSTMVITATSAYQNDNSSLTKITLGLLPYRYCWCENYGIDEDYTVMLNTTGLGMRANGNINIRNTGSKINNGVWASGSITNAGTMSSSNPSSPPLFFPRIDYDYYYSNRTHYYPWSLCLYDFRFGNGQYVIYCEDDVYVSGQYSGSVTIIAKGNIYIEGNLSPISSRSYMALITENDIYIDAPTTFINALLYAHNDNSLDPSVIYFDTSVTMIGSISADNIVTYGNVSMNGNANLNLEAFRKLKLPGL